MTTLIVAYDEDRAIGKDGQIPWYIPEDLQLFKKNTLEHAVIMGRKTYFSIPDKFRPLPNRKNIVITSEPEKYGEDRRKGVHFTPSLAGAILVANKWCPSKEPIIIGGGQIYKEALERGVVSRIIASEVHGSHEGDTFFPELTDNWEKSKITEFEKFTLFEYRRLS